jgi:hypothetical protein
MTEPIEGPSSAAGPDPIQERTEGPPMRDPTADTGVEAADAAGREDALTPDVASAVEPPREVASEVESPFTAAPPVAAAPVPPDPAPAPPPATTGWTAPGPPSDAGPVPGWVAPDPGRSGGRVRGCAIGCAVVAAILGAISVSAIVALIFLGGQIQSFVRGSVEFGTGGTGCSVTARAETFPTSSSVHFAAHLDRQVTAGETISVVQTYPDGVVEPVSQSVETPADCLFGDVISGPTAGRYTMEVRAGSELLATGGFDITP